MPWMGTVTFNELSYYNPAELTRENANIVYLRDLLATIGYDITLSYSTVGATRTDFPSVTRINNARRNIISLRGGFYVTPDMPAIVANAARKQVFDFNEANKIELNLQGIYDIYNRIIQAFPYCGTFSCGEGDLV